MKRPAYVIDPRPIRECMWQPSSATVDQVMDQIHTMRRMETTTYLRKDYLYSHDSSYNNSSSSSSCSNSSPSRPQHPIVNEATRQNMIDMLYEIGDYCNFRRETVSYAIWNLMDRYLSLPTHRLVEDKMDLQLVASTSLYIAVKLLEPVSMDVQSLADLSRGAFDSQTILEMERHMIFALDWKISHGPTPIGYVQLYLTLLQLDGVVLTHVNLWNVLWEQAQYQVELAVVDYNLTVSTNPSDVALAAVWNALESGHLDSPALVKQWQNQLMFHLGLCQEDERLQNLPNLQLALCKLQYLSSTTTSAASTEQQTEEEGVEATGTPPCTPTQEQDQQPVFVIADSDDDEDEAQFVNQVTSSSSALWMDVTETGEDYTPTRRLSLFPSPVSVMETNELFPHDLNTPTDASTNIIKEGEGHLLEGNGDDSKGSDEENNERHISLQPLRQQMKKIGSSIWRNITSSSSPPLVAANYTALE